MKRAKQCLGTYSNESILNKKFVLFSELKITSRLYMLYAFLSFNRVLYLPVVSNHGFLVVDPARLHNSNGCIGRIPLHENRNARNSPHRLVGKTQCLKSSARQKRYKMFDSLFLSRSNCNTVTFCRNFRFFYFRMLRLRVFRSRIRFKSEVTLLMKWSFFNSKLLFIVGE